METVALVIFLLVAFAAVISGAFVVLHRSPAISILSLVINAVCVAAIFLLLGDPFLAVIQVVVYVGAILVLFLFVTMLLDVQRDTLGGAGGRFRRTAVGAVILALIVVIGAAVVTGVGFLPTTPGSSEPATVESIADLLLGRYILPFEIISFLLLAAMIGVVVLTMRRFAPPPGGGTE
jgi:NADH-quinone oxidoreductase subunit J